MPEIRPSMQAVEELCAGYLMSFGKGDHGKLGHGQCSHSSCAEGNCTENKCSPTMISATRDTQFIKIDSLSTHSVAITAKGDIMAWGNGDKYRLGHGATTKEYTPRTIECINSKGRVVDISCGLGHTIALMESGDLYAWGNGSNGRLGLGDTTDRSSPTKISTSELNHPSQGIGNDQSPRPGNYVFRNVYCGASHSLAVGYDGRAYSWGKNNQGQCGHGHTNDQLSIQEISFFRDEVEEDIVHAAGGWEHTLFCSASGRVYSSGCGYKDSRRTGIPPVLGHGDCERRLKPTAIQLFVDIKEVIGKVACGWDHSLAVTVNGLVYSWGSGTNGKLGHGDEENCDLPTLIRAMENKRVKEAKAGCEHTVLLTEEQEIWTFGQGDSGRLGHGDNQTKKLPTTTWFLPKNVMEAEMRVILILLAQSLALR
uniref:RCC1-like domain-containing protein n=1 Tax=Globisporangium ultimum (strain ATCC 200006 / CBS 805.95 / DAOM BR144) TaxID=431595 RepID=K3WKG9_GLOUD